MSELRIGVVGAGATGGYLAAALSGAGYPVTLLARGRSAEVIERDGITVRGPDGTATSRVASVVRAGDPVDPVDVALLCVKSYDTGGVIGALAPMIGDRGRVLCLQNGVANEDLLAAAFGADRVLSGVLYIGAQRLGPGVIERSTDARIRFGPYRGRDTEPLWRPLRDALVAAGADCVIDEDILSSKWQKFLFNCALNPLTAITRQRLGAIRRSPSGAELFDALLDEAIDAARASGAPLASDAREQVQSTADRMDISSSMAEDLAAGRRMEREAFTGHVLRLAAEHGTEAPTTRVVDAILQTVGRPAETPPASSA
jgi:2-dehydropantoate 2-reductase